MDRKDVAGGAAAVMSQQLGDRWQDLEQEMRFLYCTMTKVNLPNDAELWWRREQRNKETVWGLVYVPPPKVGGGKPEAISLLNAPIAVRALCADHIESLIAALDAREAEVIAEVSATLGRVSSALETVRAKRVARLEEGAAVLADGLVEVLEGAKR